MDATAWASSAMVAARTRLEIATHNLANVSTGGFERMVARGTLTGSGVHVDAEPGHTHGALRHTGRDLDMAIVGDGAFRVRDAAGRVLRSRNGAFVRERDGTLRDPAGRTLVGYALAKGSSVRRGFLEEPAVDAIGEMIDVLAAQRSFESAQKVVSAVDAVRQKADDAARVK